MRGNPGSIHQEFTLDLPHPRQRTDVSLQRGKEQLLQALDLSPTKFSLGSNQVASTGTKII